MSSTSTLKRTTKPDAAKTTTINLRVSDDTRDLIDAAAESLGKSRTEFMLDCARQQAIDVVLDQRLFVLTAEQHDAFVLALDSPAAPNAALRKLFATKSPWEK
jgi:uncharacterized protein (DUF1778 family)